MQSQMAKQTKPFLAVWIVGLLIAAALTAAAFASYFYSHTAK
jgi:quinol-cytochrome oxidoreductase complex cytochrome b subunit